MKKGESLALLQLTISSGVNKILKYMKYSSKNCNSLESWRLQVSQWKIHLCLTCLQVHLGNSHFWVGDSLFRHVTSWKYNTGQTKQWTTCKRKNGGPVKEKQPVDITFHSWTFCSTSGSTCVETVVTYLKSTCFIPLLVQQVNLVKEKLNKNVLGQILYIIPYCVFLAFLDIYERCLSFFCHHNTTGFK